jgi:hypothetical protein
VLSAFKGLQALNLCFRLVAALQGYLRTRIEKENVPCQLTNVGNRGKSNPDTTKTHAGPETGKRGTVQIKAPWCPLDVLLCLAAIILISGAWYSMSGPQLSNTW